MNLPLSESCSYRVLVVDDVRAIHDDLTKVLTAGCAGQADLLDAEEQLFGSTRVCSSQFQVDSAYQGQEALAMVEAAVDAGRPYSLAFVDIRMPPGWDGVETISRLWQADPDLQVVICTAYSDYSWDDMVRRLGHSDSLVILKKPFDNIEVVQLAHALTRKWTMGRDTRARRQDLERLVREATEELNHRANHDSLTGLPNRRLFEDRLQQAILLARRNVQQAAVLYIDLDGFKIVNDTLGHATGDRLLCEAARRMQGQLRQSDTLARMGGDEFTFVAGALSDSGAAMSVAARMLEVLRPPYQVDGHTLFVTASIGISIYPEDGRDLSELLRKADAAMYEAKRHGKNQTFLYTPEIGDAANQRLELETSLRSAVENGEFSLQYQPEFDLRTQRLVRFEALLRWNHPVLGSVPPLQFVPIAEESGLIPEVGRWAIEEACRTARKWSDAGCTGLPVAVNISAQQIAKADFVDMVAGIVQKTGLDPGLLELELTESVLIDDFDDVAPKIVKLRELGIAVTIDDFGSGYSSFSYLEKLPVTAVKVDRSFLRFIDTPRARSVVDGIVKLAHSIGLRVVVEGVETAAQLAALQACGANEVQGYWLGRPGRVEEYFPELANFEPAGEDTHRMAGTLV